ncbi:MAG: TetR/AcrR family transcriptional regulator [Clostridiales Family XIII bacterium]|jgi:AcrR family transcriptional regulator|nr:TetR/AcrR family transcriptional regulator [Clostridiales Family XIII bacterium]
MDCSSFEKYRHGKHEGRRNHILDAAFAVFIENGITNTKMEDIARAAGYGKSTLYDYFGSKDEIFSELLRVKFTERYRLIAASAGKENSPTEKLRAFILGELGMIVEYGGKERLEGMLMASPETVLSEGFCQAIHDIILFKFHHISAYIKDGIADGSFERTDPYIAASLVIGASMSYFGTVTSPEYKAVTAGSVTTDEDRLQSFFTLIFRALGVG